MAKKVILSFVFLSLFASCANQLSKNVIKESETLIGGGVSAKEQWDDQMILKRVSWYKEFSLLFDTHIWKVPANSPFINWFSATEKRYLNKCEEFHIVLSYSMNSDLISERDFQKQLESQGATYMEIPHFKANIRIHPHFDENSFQRFSVGGLCVKKAGTQLKITFPGYHEKVL